MIQEVHEDIGAIWCGIQTRVECGGGLWRCKEEERGRRADRGVTRRILEWKGPEVARSCAVGGECNVWRSRLNGATKAEIMT